MFEFAETLILWRNSFRHLWSVPSNINYSEKGCWQILIIRFFKSSVPYDNQCKYHTPHHHRCSVRVGWSPQRFGAPPFSRLTKWQSTKQRATNWQSIKRRATKWLSTKWQSTKWHSTKRRATNWQSTKRRARRTVAATICPVPIGV